MLTSIGVEVSAAGVGLHYGAARDGGVLDGWLVDEWPTPTRSPRVEAAGIACRAVPLMMTDHDATAAMAGRSRSSWSPMSALGVVAPDGVPEVRPGDDLAALLLAARVDLRDGDVVAVTSKVVSKAEGRVRPGSREEALAGETVRVVARRGPTTIVRTRHGLTMAAAGVDASNVAPGTVVLLPVDPDASARALRGGCAGTGANVGVVVTDTAGRAWREGQTDIAIGAAGLLVARGLRRPHRRHGNELAVTAPAVADEIAGAAELAQGKLGGRPFAVVRGRPTWCCRPARTARAPRRWSAPRRPTCSGTARARRCCAPCGATGRPSPLRRSGAGRRLAAGARPRSLGLEVAGRRRRRDGLVARHGDLRAGRAGVRARLGGRPGWRARLGPADDIDRLPVRPVTP